MEENWAGGCPGCGGAPHTGGYWHQPNCPSDPNLTPLPAPSIDPPLGQYTYYPYNPPEPQYGWVCPKCGAVYSPFMPYCDNCRGQDKFATETTGGTSDDE